MAQTGKINVEITGDATQLLSAIDRSKLAAEDLSRKVQNVSQAQAKVFEKAGLSAEQAVKAADGLGISLAKLKTGLKAVQDDQDKAAKSTERWVNAVKDSTAYLQGQEAVLRRRAEVLGVSADVVEREIAAYRKTRDEINASNAALRAGGRQLDQFGMTARQTAAALRQVPAQFTDIVVSLQGGQAPMTVLLQQGGQLKDVFGGVGNAVKALGGYMLTLVTPLNAVLAAIGGLGYAYYKGSQEADAFNKAIILSGSSGAVTADNLKDVATAAQGVGVTHGAAADAIAKFVSAGIKGRDVLAGYAASAIRFSDTFGVKIDDIVKNFAKLGEDPLKASVDLTAQLGGLTAATYDQIQALLESGQATEAAKLAQDSYSAALSEASRLAQQDLGLIERGWIAVKNATKGAADAALAIGRPQTLQDQITGLERVLANPLGQSPTGDIARAAALRGLSTSEFTTTAAAQTAATREELDALLQLRDGLDEAAQAQKNFNEQNDAAIRLSTAARGPLQKQREAIAALSKDLETALAGAKNPEEKAQWVQKYLDAVQNILKNHPAKEQISEFEKSVKAGLKLFGDLTAQASGLAPDFAEKWQNLADAFKAGKIGVEQLTQAQAVLLSQQPSMVAAAKEQKKMLEDLNKEYLKQVEGIEKSAKTVEDRAALAKTELENLRLQASGMATVKGAAEELAIARLNEQAAALAAEGGNERQIAAIEREIAARKELIQTFQEKNEFELRKKAAEKTAKEFEKTSKEIEKSLTDALMRSFESGKGFAEAFRDNVQNLFKTLVLRPIIQAAVQPIAGSITGALGVTGGVSNGLSLGSNLYGAYNAYMGGTTGLATQFAQSSIGTSLGLSYSTAETAALMGADFGIGGGATAASLTGAGSALATAAPYLAAAFAVYSIASSLSKGETRSGGTYGYSAGGAQFGSAFQNLWSGEVGGTLAAGQTGFIGGPSGGQIGDPSVTKAAIDATVASINGFFTTLGSSERVDQFWGKLESSDRGRGGVLSGGVLSSGKAFGETGLGSNYAGTLFESGTPTSLSAQEAAAAFVLDLKQATIQALQQASDIPKLVREFLSTIDAETLDAQAADTILQTITALQQFSAAMETLGVDAANWSIETIKMAGGLEAITSAANSFYENFYSQEEKRARVLDQLSDSFKQLGYDLPASREAFRALAESIDQTSVKGQTAYASVLQLSSAFAAVVPATNAAAAAITGVVNAFASTAASLQDSFSVFKATAAGSDVMSLLLGGYDYSTTLSARLDIINQIADIEQSALQKTNAAATEMASERIAALNEELSVVQALSNAAKNLRKFVDDLRNSTVSPLTSAQRLASLQAQYGVQLSLARGGDVESFGALQQTAGLLLEQRRLTASTSAEYAIAFGRIAGELDQLAISTTDQTASQEASIKSQIKVQQDTLDSLKSIDTSSTRSAGLLESLRIQAETQFRQDIAAATSQLIATDNIAEVLAQLPPDLAAVLSAALASELSTQLSTFASAIGQTISESSIRQAATGGQSIAATKDQLVIDAIKGVVGADLTTQTGLFDKLVDDLGYSVSKVQTLITAASGTFSAADVQYLSIAKSINDIYQEVLGRSAEEGGLKYWTDQVVSGVFSSDTIKQAIIDAAVGVDRESVAAYLASLPKLASGTNYVPRDMVAMIHEGEAVVPKEFNPSLTGGAGSAALIEEIQSLREDSRAQARAVVQLQTRFTKVLERWDTDGLPTTRVETV